MASGDNGTGRNPAGDEAAGLAEHLPLLPWTASPDGAVTWLGSQWETYSGHPLLSLLGRGWQNLIPGKDRAEMDRAWAAARQHGVWEDRECRLRRADGAWCRFLVRALPRRDPDTGQISGWAGFHIETESSRPPAAQAERQAAARREQAVLARLSAALNTVPSDDHLATTLTTVAEGAAELFATPFAAVLRRSADDAALVLTAHTPGVHPAPGPARRSALAERVLQSGQPEALEDVASAGEELAARIVFLPQTEPATPATVPRAVLAAPLVHEDKLLGVLEVYFQTPRPFDADDHRSISLLADQAAVAIAHGEAYARERAARAEAEVSARRAKIVAEVAQALSRPVSLDAVLDAAIEALASAFAGGGCSIWLHNAQTRRLRLATVRGESETGRRVVAETAEDSETVVGEAFRRRDVVIYLAPDGSLPRLTRRLVNLSGRREATLAAAPLVVAGRVLGVLSLVSGRQELDPTWIETLRALGAQVAEAIERANLYEREHRIASRLQNALLPTLQDEAILTTTGLAIAHRYRPGTEGITIGGDFYDLWSLSPAGEADPRNEPRTERLAVLLGDVSGKGLEAAVQTAALRHAVLAYAHENPDPATVMDRLNRLILARNLLPGAFATMFFAVIDGDGRIHYCSAGHESVLLRRGSGGGTMELEATAPALGLTPALAPILAERALMEPGDELLLYTDGITEARDPGTRRLLGVDGLAALLSEVHADLGAGAGVPLVAASLLERVEAYAGGRLEDDAALLVIARPGGASLQSAVASTTRMESCDDRTPF